MQRILILGNCGAGKSTLARELHARTGIELIHLDRHYYLPGWQQPTEQAWRDTVRQLVDRPRWIMDGNYAGTLDLRLPRADTVFFLDRSAPRCAFRVLRRWWSAPGATRPDMAPGCGERFDLAFLRYVWTYNRRRRPALLRQLATLGPGQRLIHL